MKIGLIAPGFSADENDWCIPALRNFVKQLAAYHSVHVFALEYPYRCDAYSIYGARVHSIGGSNRGKRYAPRLWFDTLSAIYTEHRLARFDVLHAFWINEPGAIALFAGRALGIPVIASVAGGELVGIGKINYGGQLDWIERTVVLTVMRAVDRVTVGSRYLQMLAARWRADACVLPLGVDTKMFSPSKSELRALKILNVGSLVPVKGQTLLLDAFAQINDRNACLEIIGAGALEPELRNQAIKLGIAARVAISGPVAHDELASRYQTADLFVQSSLHEAQGMAVLEAAASGVPIAGTPVGILPELAEQTGGVAIRETLTDDLRDGMVRVIRARDEMGQNARRAVERCFSLEATWNGWMELYHLFRQN